MKSFHPEANTTYDLTISQIFQTYVDIRQVPKN